MSVETNFRDAFRLITWRRPLSPFATLTPVAILGAATVIAILSIGVQWLAAGESRYFQIYGLNALAAWIAASLGVIVLFARKDATGATTRNLVLVWAATCVGASALPLLAHIAGAVAKQSGAQGLAWLVPLGGILLLLLSSTLAARRAFQAVGARRPALRGIAFTLAWWTALAAVPNWPVFLGANFVPSQANLWEMAAAAKRESAGQEQDFARRRAEREERDAKIEAAQPARLDAELAALTPRDRKKKNIFIVGVAGWSDQDVFLKETEQSLDIMRKRLGATGKTIALVNNEGRSDAHPIATIQNLAQALRGVASKMNLEDDVLILTMTSHGSRDGFALENRSLVGRTLSPKTLRAMLDEIGFRNRVVIVSACYSGVFLPELAGPRTMVISAASATRTSFGCSNDRNWTYFGEAFFDHGLREEPTLANAFDKAKALIAKWETEQKLDPSDPQIYVGEDLRRRFPALIGDPPARQAQATDAARNME